ncbi:hypothetical protein KAU11_01015, partial [Candidatus Babeliales bacterium]|nr:hypothetical protein [Candidatus Babeliales bacterium]
YPLFSAKCYLDAMSKGMENAASLAEAVAEHTGQIINTKKIESKNLKDILELCAAGPGEDIEEEYLAALKLGAKRLRPVIKKILLVLTKDPRFEEQRKNADRERQHQQEMKLRQERNNIYWHAVFR